MAKRLLHSRRSHAAAAAQDHRNSTPDNSCAVAMTVFGRAMSVSAQTFVPCLIGNRQRDATPEWECAMIKLTICSSLLAEFGRALTLAAMSSRAQMTICETCGQTFDLRKLELAYHHGPEPHEPL